MNITIYTTSKSKWYRDEAREVEKAYANFFPLTFTFIDINEPTPVFKIDKDGDKVLDWDWFTKTFPARGACFHFNKKFARKWKIALGGQRNSYSKESPQFWVTADREGTEGYTFSNFRRLLFHESAHFWEDVDNEIGNALIQSSVHNFDYKLKQIHKYHELVNFKAYQASIVTSL